MRHSYRHGNTIHEVAIEPLGKDEFRVSVNGAILELRVEARGDALDLVSRDGLVRAWVTRDGRLRFVTAPGVGEAVLEKLEVRGRARAEVPGPDLSSPMPGKVVRVLVVEGDAVVKGQALVVVEAMKTELTLAAPRAGRVGKVAARNGEKCDAGQTLVELRAADPPLPAP